MKTLKYFIAASMFQTVLLGCATVHPHLQNGTLFLAEVGQIAKIDEIQSGFFFGATEIPSPMPYLEACGHTADSIKEGNTILVNYSYYWHNVAVGIYRSSYGWVYAPGSIDVKKGQLVEVEYRSIPENPKMRCAVVNSIYANSLKEGKCEYRETSKGGVFSTLDKLNPIGGSGSASLHCDGLIEKKWEQIKMGRYNADVWSRSKNQSISPDTP